MFEEYEKRKIKSLEALLCRNVSIPIDGATERFDIGGETSSSTQKSYIDPNMPSASPQYQEFTTMEVVNFPVVEASFVDNYPADKHVMINELYAEETIAACTQATGGQSSTCCTMTTTTDSSCHTIPIVSEDSTSFYQMGTFRYSLEPQTQCIETLPMYSISSHGSCDMYNGATVNHDDSSGKSLCFSTHYGSSNSRNNLCINDSKSCLSFSRSRDCQYDRYSHGTKCRIPDPEQVNILSWTTKHPINWSEAEVLDWLYSCVQDHKIDGESFRGEAFCDIDGSKICQMTLDDFVKLESTYGAILYNLLRKLYDDVNFEKPYEFPDFTECDFSESFSGSDESYLDQTTVSPHSIHRNQYPNPDGNPQSNMECILPTFSNSVISGATCQYPLNRYHQSSPRRRPGRPRLKALSCDGDPRSSKDKKAKNQHLWEFIYDALMNPLYNPQYLRWENQREGIFRFVQSEAVAQLWGSLKNNENMTYEKLSRAMRHYYKRGILERVEGRRLVYKFSLNAMERVREKKVLAVAVS